MQPLRYLIRVVSDAALPDVLLRRQRDDCRRFDADLARPHDLRLSPDRSDLDELARRTFSEVEALAACREWHETQPLLDVVVSGRECTLVIVPWTHVLSLGRPLRLLPLVGESGATVELAHAHCGWISNRADARGTDVHPFIYRPRRGPAGETLCAEVSAVWCLRGQLPRVVTARIAPGERLMDCCERFPFFEQRWLESHYGGFDALNAAPVLMTPLQAEAVAEVLMADADFTQVEVRTGSLRNWMGSAEFSAGATYPVGRMRAHPALSAAAGTPIHWVVWPQPEA
jgi:hypothetical protein